VNREWVTGLVVDDNDEPVAGAHLEIVASTVRLPEFGMTSDSNGQVSINLPPGTFRLRAERAGRYGEVTVTVPGAGPLRIVLK
jgi:hypothetical protein